MMGRPLCQPPRFSERLFPTFSPTPTSLPTMICDLEMGTRLARLVIVVSDPHRPQAGVWRPRTRLTGYLAWLRGAGNSLTHQQF